MMTREMNVFCSSLLPTYTFELNCSEVSRPKRFTDSKTKAHFFCFFKNLEIFGLT